MFSCLANRFPLFFEYPPLSFSPLLSRCSLPLSLSDSPPCTLVPEDLDALATRIFCTSPASYHLCLLCVTTPSRHVHRLLWTAVDALSVICTPQRILAERPLALTQKNDVQIHCPELILCPSWHVPYLTSPHDVYTGSHTPAQNHFLHDTPNLSQIHSAATSPHVNRLRASFGLSDMPCLPHFCATIYIQGLVSIRSSGGPVDAVHPLHLWGYLCVSWIVGLIDGEEFFWDEFPSFVFISSGYRKLLLESATTSLSYAWEPCSSFAQWLVQFFLSFFDYCHSTWDVDGRHLHTGSLVCTSRCNSIFPCWWWALCDVLIIFVRMGYDFPFVCLADLFYSFAQWLVRLFFHILIFIHFRCLFTVVYYFFSITCSYFLKHGRV